MNAAALPTPARADPRTLQRCLLLAVLLHVWLVLVFGNATGSAAPGQGVWGSLSVRLTGTAPGRGDAPADARDWRDNGATGTAPTPRQGGQVRPAAPPAPEPGAAELGRWNPREVPAEAARTDEPSTAAPSPATLTLPEGFRPVERVAPAPLRPATAPAPTALPAPDLPAAVGRLETRPDAAVARLAPSAELRAPGRSAVTAPTAELPPVPNRLEAPPAPARAALPRPSELRPSPPAATAALPATELPAAVSRLEAAPTAAPSATLPRAAELRATPAAPAAQRLPSTTDLPAAVRRLEAQSDAPSASAALPRATDLRAAPAGATAPAVPAADLPAPVRRLEAADGGTVTPLAPATSSSPAPQPPAGTRLPELDAALPGQVPAGDPFAAPRASAGSPDAGSRQGHDLATAPSAAASAPRPPLNLTLPRGDIAARRGPGLLDLLPQPPERKSKLEQEMEAAGKKDCRKAYSGAGLLAIVPLAIDAARDKSGCKW